jgi:acyl-CoA hydrolase
VYFGSVFDYDHVLALQSSITQLGDRSVRIGEKPLLVSGIRPGTRHYSGAIARPNFVFVGVDQRIKRRAVDQPFFNEERFECLYAQGWIRRRTP